MPGRLPTRALTAAACALALAGAAGCGGGGDAPARGVPGTRLAVYSSMPFEGASAAAAADVVRGERLALREAGGRAGRYRVRLVSLDAAAPRGMRWDPARISQNARRAAHDADAVAYVGELDAGASAISIPLLNEAGIAQVSPLDTAMELTRRTLAVTGAPERYYPNQKRVGRTFVRLVPSDLRQADALLRAMAAAGVRRVAIVEDGNASGLALAEAVRAKAPVHGIVATPRAGEVDPHALDERDLATRVMLGHPDAVLYAGDAHEGAIALCQALHASRPGLRLFLPAAVAAQPGLVGIAATGLTAYATRPILPLRDYPPAARRFARVFAAAYGTAPHAEALYGYEAMRVVLAAIRGAGSSAGDDPLTRADVVRALFSLGSRAGVLGRYRLDAAGDTSLRRFGAYRFDGGHPRFLGAVTGAAPSAAPRPSPGARMRSRAPARAAAARAGRS